MAYAHNSRTAYVAVIAFHVALLSFGWGFHLRSVPILRALTTPLRGERRATATSPRTAVVRWRINARAA